MISNDLNLKTKIKISDKEFDFELWSINQGQIKETKLDGQRYGLIDEDKPKDVIEEPVEKPTVTEEPTIEELSKRKMVRAPNNTMLFLNWLKELKEPEFDISDFTTKYPSISMDKAKLIIAQQITKNRLRQMSNVKFRVIRLDDDNGQ